MVRPVSFTVRHWRAILLLAAGVLFAPSRASAECGDYITIIKHGSDSGHTQANTSHDQSAQHHINNSMPPSTPCKGPNCSSSPSHKSTPLAPVVLVTSTAKELTQPSLNSSGDSDTPSKFNRDDIFERPIHHSSTIFHPPRQS